MAKNDFQYGRWNSCTLQCHMWLWNRDSEFDHQVAPPCNVIRGSGMTCHWIRQNVRHNIYEFYMWFRFRPHHHSRHVILHQAPKFYPNRTTLCRKKMTSCRFSGWRISTIMDFMDPIMRSLKSPTLDAGMWRYHANRMDSRRIQFDLRRVDAYI